MCFQCGIKKHVQTICQQMKYCKFNAGVKNSNDVSDNVHSHALTISSDSNEQLYSV